VVCVADLGGVRPTVGGRLLVDPRTGLAFRPPVPWSADPHPTPRNQEIQELLSSREQAESRRVLYVALTGPGTPSCSPAWPRGTPGAGRRGSTPRWPPRRRCPRRGLRGRGLSGAPAAPAPELPEVDAARVSRALGRLDARRPSGRRRCRSRSRRWRTLPAAHVGTGCAGWRATASVRAAVATARSPHATATLLHHSPVSCWPRCRPRRGGAESPTPSPRRPWPASASASGRARRWASSRCCAGSLPGSPPSRRGGGGTPRCRCGWGSAPSR
jgi:hypothetical protein